MLRHIETDIGTASSTLEPRDPRHSILLPSIALTLCLPLFHSLQESSITTPRGSFACAWSIPIALVRTSEVKVTTPVEQEPDQISCIASRVTSNPAERCTAHASPGSPPVRAIRRGIDIASHHVHEMAHHVHALLIFRAWGFVGFWYVVVGCHYC